MKDNASYNHVTILVAEDDDGHAVLIQDLLEDVGVRNPVIRFRDGQEVLDYLGIDKESQLESGGRYLLLLDIRMPRVDGVEVLRRMKADARLRDIPVVMLTTTDDPREVQNCYQAGCSFYITKPVEFTRFASVLRQVGLFLLVVKLPVVQDADPGK
jgi:CheY-like chemotaxis protein